MANKLEIYNAALRELGQVKLSSLTENVKSRRVLDDAYDAVVADCLAAGSWNFAMETIKADYDTGVTPNFGFQRVFGKPSDWVRTHALSADEFLEFPLLHYYDDVNYWSADVTPIYVRYVSNDTGLGLELTRWPRSFTRYVELELAERVCIELTENENRREEIARKRDKARTTALNHDAMNEPNPKFPPPSSWTLARSSRSGGDRGSRSRLIG